MYKQFHAKNCFEMNEIKYLSKLGELTRILILADLCSLCAKRLRIINDIFDICCAVALLTEVTEDSFRQRVQSCC